MRRFLADALPHVILALFSAMILLPLLWVLRVSLTDKLTAYKIPPEIGTHRPHELCRDLHRLSVPRRGSPTAWSIALLATAISLPLATAMAYAFARFNTGGSPLRLGVLASQMLPPIILVLPLFGMFLTGRPDAEPRRRSSSRI